MTANNMHDDWWKQAVVYQVYPRSFRDANGDGLGDIAGITEQVPYLKHLGVDAIWLSPFYPSELADGGYDVIDYRNVDPRLDFTLGRIGMPWRSHEYNEKWCRNLGLYGQFSGKKPYPAPESPYVKPGIVPWGASSLNCILIRYADVLLMKAEALIEQNKDLDTARELINEVRRKAARSLDPAYSPVNFNASVAHYAVGEYPATGWTQSYARKALRMERRLELAMEGLRWFDLVRWGTAVETVNAYYAAEGKIRSYYEGASLTEN